jgi:hypothetical protein
LAGRFADEGTSFCDGFPRAFRRTSGHGYLQSFPAAGI